jgi:hypothetical protein
MQQSPCGNHHYSDCGWFDKPSLPKAGQEEGDTPEDNAFSKHALMLVDMVLAAK